MVAAATTNYALSQRRWHPSCTDEAGRRRTPKNENAQRAEANVARASHMSKLAPYLHREPLLHRIKKRRGARASENAAHVVVNASDSVTAGQGRWRGRVGAAVDDYKRTPLPSHSFPSRVPAAVCHGSHDSSGSGARKRRKTIRRRTQAGRVKDLLLRPVYRRARRRVYCHAETPVASSRITIKP
ncbi:hypothetical protein MTO96_009048 [Rhipicephalus appendiculatus]